MAKDLVKVVSMTGGVIVLAGIAAWMGLAHGCEEPKGRGVIAGQVSLVRDY